MTEATAGTSTAAAPIRKTITPVTCSVRLEGSVTDFAESIGQASPSRRDDAQAKVRDRPTLVASMQPLFEHRLDLAGYRTRALELEGDGPPLLLLHGFSDSADTWRILLDRLGPRGPPRGGASTCRASAPATC